jgi:carbamoyltransferase
MATRILGISAYYHDSAACLVATARSSRPRRRSASRGRSTTRASRRTPSRTASRRAASAAELDYVGFYDKPMLKFERLLENYIGVAPRASSRC